MFVSAWFVFSNSFSALILCVVLEFAVITVLAVHVGVASSTELKSSVARLYPGVWPFGFVGKPCIPPILEGSDLVFIVLSVGVAVIVDGSDGFGSFGTGFP
jgi:hypothetical protein